jgi:hypothetical protein
MLDDCVLLAAGAGLQALLSPLQKAQWQLCTTFIVLLHLLFVTIMFFRSLRSANIDEFVIIVIVNYAM